MKKKKSKREKGRIKGKNEKGDEFWFSALLGPTTASSWDFSISLNSISLSLSLFWWLVNQPSLFCNIFYVFFFTLPTLRYFIVRVWRHRRRWLYNIDTWLLHLPQEWNKKKNIFLIFFFFLRKVLKFNQDYTWLGEFPYWNRILDNLAKRIFRDPIWDNDDKWT